MPLIGMNVAEVQHLADQLRSSAEQLRSMVTSVDGRVTSTSWVGHDADVFKHQWWPSHRQALLNAAEAIAGLGQSARNNATEQEQASSVNGSGGSSAPAAAAAGAAGVAAVGGAVAAASPPTSSGSQGPGNFSNADIVKVAETHPVGTHGGQCRAFVANVVSDATGGKVDLQAYANPQHDYFTAFEQNGTRMTDVSQLRPGDVVQIGEFEPHVHTFIVDGTPTQRSDGTWWAHVIDSNSDPRNAPETVRSYDRQISLSDEARAYRLGRV